MSYPTNPAAADHRARPTTVTVSSYLLWLTAAASLVSAVILLSGIGPSTEAYRDVYAGTDLEGTEGVAVAVSVIGAVINILFGVALAVLAIFNNRGRNGARITTWVLGGISLCCSGFGVAGTALTNSMNLDSTGGSGPSASEVQARLDQALPGWYEPATIALAAVSLLAVLGAIILLALPASNAYFRKPQAAWDPSLPYPYPGQQPPQGYPPQGSPSAYPQYPGTGQPAYPPPPGPGAPPPPAAAPPASTPPAGGTPEAPHTGSVPPTDPWSARPAGEPQRPVEDPNKPPSDPADGR